MNVLLIVVVGVIILLIARFVKKFLSKPCPNPFEKDSRKPIRPKVFDQKKRDEVLKQGFSINKIPKNLDAIIIGSGIGAMTTGVIMSKTGKKVLLLEQHDQAGGCCHTFIEKGYEFDVGIHYVGDLHHESPTKTLVAQLTDGQLEWEPLDEQFDQVVFKEPGQDIRRYFMHSTLETQKRYLKENFPEEHEAIDKFYSMCLDSDESHRKSLAIKFFPMWLVKIMVALNLTGFISDYWRYNTKTTKQVVEELTNNQELRDIFCYCFGDYGTCPSLSGFAKQGGLIAHFLKGRAAYPVNGASEIAFHMIPVIERSEGKVLVRAKVEKIILDNGEAKGVQVKHGSSSYEIYAPKIISNAGALNTFSRMLPPEVAESSRLWSVFSKVPQGVGTISIFLGFDAPAEELDLSVKQNIWMFTKSNIDKCFMDYNALSADEAEEEDIPLMFLSFPSTKDPTWDQKYPGKSTAAIVGLANYNWFADWSEDPCKRRGDDYDARKKTIAQRCIDHVCDLYPKVKDHLDYVNIASPVTNNFYLGAQKGEIYGLDHSQTRFQPMNVAKLRPKTDIPGLYLTGQDVCTGGFMGGLYGGVLCAMQVLERDLIKDLAKIYMDTKKSD